MKCKLFLLLCFLGVAFVMETDASQRKKKKATDETTEVKESAYDKLFKKEHVVAKGLITLHRVDNKLYFELPLKLLNKDMLLGSTITEISDNGDGLVGQKPTEPLHIQFTQVDSNIQIRQIITFGRIDTAISRYQIPEQIMRNKTPRNEMIQLIIRRMQLMACVNAAYRPSYLYHLIPIAMLVCQRTPAFRPD